jgi:hypothetical protein
MCIDSDMLRWNLPGIEPNTPRPKMSSLLMVTMNIFVSAANGKPVRWGRGGHRRRSWATVPMLRSCVDIAARKQARHLAHIDCSYWAMTSQLRQLRGHGVMGRWDVVLRFILCITSLDPQEHLQPSSYHATYRVINNWLYAVEFLVSSR